LTALHLKRWRDTAFVMTHNPISEHLDTAKRDAEEIRANLDRLTRQYEVVRARVDAYEVAFKAFEDASPRQPVKGQRAVIRTRNRSASTEWQSVFQVLYMFQDSDSFGYDEIFEAATRASVDVKRPSLRTKMMNYVNDGHVERVGDGKFVLTSKGMTYFKIGAKAPKENEPRSETAGGSDAETWVVDAPQVSRIDPYS
jgi:hypothetical protein